MIDVSGNKNGGNLEERERKKNENEFLSYMLLIHVIFHARLF